MGMNRRFGTDKTWTGNDHGVLKLLFTDCIIDTLSVDDMSELAEKYTGKTRFEGRLKEHKVLRWVESNNIPFEDMLVDFLELKLITPEIVDNSVKIKNYEDTIFVERWIKEQTEGQAI